MPTGARYIPWVTVTAAQAAETLRRREEDRRAAARLRAEGLLAKLPKAKQILQDSYGVHRVVVFGSMATGEPQPESDLDLAVEGLAREHHFAAMADLMAALGCTLDLVRIEEAPPSLAQRIAAEGRRL
jgi:predicted nucleotidyltransferase